MLFSVLHRDVHSRFSDLSPRRRLNTTYFLPKTANWCVTVGGGFVFLKRTVWAEPKVHFTLPHASSSMVPQPPGWGCPAESVRAASPPGGRPPTGCPVPAAVMLHILPSVSHHQLPPPFLLVTLSQVGFAVGETVSTFAVRFCFNSP